LEIALTGPECLLTYFFYISQVVLPGVSQYDRLVSFSSLLALEKMDVLACSLRTTSPF